MEQINPSNTDNMSGAMSRCKQLAMFIALVSFVLVIVCVSAFTGMLNMMGRHAFAMQSLGSIPVVVLGGIATYSLLKRTANAVALAKGFAWILLATSVFESYALITEYEAWMLAHYHCSMRWRHVTLALQIEFYQGSFPRERT